MGSYTDHMIYLDSSASTPESPEVIEAIARASRDLFGNAHSEHACGRKAMSAVGQARECLANLLGCEAEEILFTSGATESNNIAIQGIVLAMEAHETLPHIVTTTIEHKSILESAKMLAKKRARVTYCGVDKYGIVKIDEIESICNSIIHFMTIMMVNNEVGVIQDIAKIKEYVRSPQTILHSDITQAVGRIPVNVDGLGLHLASFSAHKMCGPKGIGGLFVSKDTPVRPLPVYHGGGHELGLRPGTLAVPLIVGFGTAAELAAKELAQNRQKVEQLRDLFLNRLQQEGINFEIIGDRNSRVPHSLNIRFFGVSGDQLVGSLQPQVALSTGSACASGEIQPSHVLSAMGLSTVASKECVRFGFSPSLTHADAVDAANLIIRQVCRLKES